MHENALALSSIHDSCSRSFARLNVSGNHTNAARMRQIGPREKMIKSPGVTPCNNFYRWGWLRVMDILFCQRLKKNLKANLFRRGLKAILERLLN